METYLKIFILLGTICHQIDQLKCQNQIDNCGTRYQCKTSVCIEASLICDGKPDCQDGDDEEGCVMADKDNNSTFCVKTDAKCHCSVSNSKLQLNCTEAGLLSFPKFLNKNITTTILITGSKIPKLTTAMFNGFMKLDNLTLTHNEISIIERNTFAAAGRNRFGENANIVYIDLSDNNITNLTSRIFQPLRYLSRLKLARNQINTIEIDAFNNLTIMRGLDLSGNKLTKLTPGMFNGLRKVPLIDLHDNEISIIETGTFRGLEELSLLNMSGNKITKLTPGMFEGLIYLGALYLGDNEIDTIENGTWDSFTSELYTLDLHGNKLSLLKLGTFDSPTTSIGSLILSDNGITAIERHSFNALSALRALDLSHNNLTKIPSYAFENNKKITFLSLSENAITHIEPSTFHNLTELATLNLSSNPLHDVDKNLFSMNHQMTSLFVDDTDICCKTSRKNCNSKTSPTFFCAQNAYIWYIVSAAIFLVLLIILIIVVLKRNICNVKRYFAGKTYTAPGNEGPDQL